MVLGKLDTYIQKINLDHFLTLYTSNSKCINDLNVRPKTVKLLEGNIRSKLFDTTLSNTVLGMSPQARTVKQKQTNDTVSN